MKAATRRGRSGNLDPGGRTRETVSVGKITQDIIDHYAGSGNSPAWTIEPTSGHWTRNIQGIGGGLVALETNGEAPVLQLSNLHGDIVATAALSETATKLLSSTPMTEYGTPTTTTPAKYAWLGAGELPTELPSGVITMGVRSYVPQIGRFLQTDPVPGGSANAYAYTFGDPVDESDPTGNSGLPVWFIAFAKENAQAVAEAYAAREAAARAAAAAAAAAAASSAGAAAPGSSAPPAEEPLGGSAGWTCEDAFITNQDADGCPVIEEISETESGSLNAHSASVLGAAEEIGKELSHGLNAAAKFIGRNAARFADLLSNVSTMSSAALGGIMVGSYAGEACLVGAGAGPVAPLVWLGCGTFFAGTLGIELFEGWDSVNTVKKIH